MNKTQKARHYLKVTPRDIELFKYLFIYKGATAKQIYRKILQDLELKNSKIFVVSVTELKKSFTQLKVLNALKECLNFKFQKEIYL